MDDARRLGFAPWNDATIAVGQQIGQVMNVVDSARDGWAEVAGRNVPGSNAVKLLQQGPVQPLDGGGVGKVDRVVLVLIRPHKGRQLRTAGYQLREVVAGTVPVARVQPVFFGGNGAGRLLHGT